jgi:cyclic-di-GMP phosphodiesterase, flagellum assembly factor TipF
MRFTNQIFILAAFVVIAAVSGQVLARAAPDLGLTLLPTAIVIFLLEVGLWTFISGYLNSEKSRARLSELASSIKGLKKAVSLMDDKVSNFSERGESKELIAEVRVLQTLLSQLASARGAGVDEPVTQGAAKQKGDADAVVRGEPSSGLDDAAIRKIMDNALKENRIDLYVQPIVTLPARKHVHYECYSRVRDGAGETIYAREYMPMAKKSGLTGTLDNLLLFRLIQLVRKLGHRRPNVQFFCNISSSSMNDEEFFPQFIDFMMSNERLSNRLVFEFAQADVIAMSSDVERSLLLLGQRGFRFSMDQATDMNMDIAGLSQRYFRFVKMDGATLVKGSDSNIHPEDLSEAMARHEIILIASKIEDEKMVLSLLDHNVGHAQGYLFGEPKINTTEAGPEIGTETDLKSQDKKLPDETPAPAASEKASES